MFKTNPAEEYLARNHFYHQSSKVFPGRELPNDSDFNNGRDGWGRGGGDREERGENRRRQGGERRRGDGEEREEEETKEERKKKHTQLWVK